MAPPRGRAAASAVAGVSSAGRRINGKGATRRARPSDTCSRRPRSRAATATRSRTCWKQGSGPDRPRHDARRDVDSDTADLAADPLALAGVDAGAQLQAEPRYITKDCVCCAYGLRGLLERAQEAVAGSVHLAPAECLELLRDGPLVRGEQSSATAASPIRTARSVDPTMSVNRIVARNRSGGRPRIHDGCWATEI